MPQGKFVDLVNLFLTTIYYAFNSQFYQQTDGAALKDQDQHLQPQQKFMHRLMKKLQYLRHYILQEFGNNLLITFIKFLNVITWKTFSITYNNLHQNLL